MHKKTARISTSSVFGVGLGVLALMVVASLSPVAAQVVDSGSADPSLECRGVVVEGVDSNDSLNVREGPGVGFEIVTTLEPAAGAIATGLTQQVGNSTWYQIGLAECEPVGWVNSSFLRVEPAASATTETTPETAALSTLPSTGAADPAQPSDSRIELSPFATGLLALGVLGLFAGVIMAVRSRQHERVGGPPPGMVGPPGGPYFLARVDDHQDAEPRVIQIGGRRRSDPPEPDASESYSPESEVTLSDELPSEPIDEPLSAFPLIPDFDSEFEVWPEPVTRPTSRLFGTTSLSGGNSTEDKKGS